MEWTRWIWSKLCNLNNYFRSNRCWFWKNVRMKLQPINWAIRPSSIMNQIADKTPNKSVEFMKIDNFIRKPFNLNVRRCQINSIQHVLGSNLIYWYFTNIYQSFQWIALINGRFHFIKAYPRCSHSPSEFAHAKINDWLMDVFCCFKTEII